MMIKNDGNWYIIGSEGMKFQRDIPEIFNALVEREEFDEADPADWDIKFCVPYKELLRMEFGTTDVPRNYQRRFRYAISKTCRRVAHGYYILNDALWDKHIASRPAYGSEEEYDEEFQHDEYAMAYD